MRAVLLFAVTVALAACSITRPKAEEIWYTCGFTTSDRVFVLLQPHVTVRPFAEAPSVDWSAVTDSVAYPDFAHRARIEGTVVATVTIDSTGRATEVAVTSTPAEVNFMLIEAAEKGLLSASYLPAPATASRFRVGVAFWHDPNARAN